MHEDRLDQRWILNAGDDPDGTAARPTGLDIDVEHALQALRPRHGGVTLGWRLVLCVIRRAAVVASTPFRRRHERPVPAVRCEHAVEARQVDPGLWDQGGQSSNEVQRLEDDMCSAIVVRRLELITHVAIGGERQTFCRYRRAGDVAAQPLQLGAFIGLRRHTRMQGKPLGSIVSSVTAFGLTPASQPRFSRKSVKENPNEASTNRAMLSPVNGRAFMNAQTVKTT